MGIGRTVSSAVVGLGLLAAGFIGIDDDTTRDENGEIVASGDAGTFSIKLGDCLNGAPIDVVESLQGVPCSTPHDVEAYHVFNLPDGDYPGAAAVSEAAGNACSDAFEPFVGHPSETSIYDISSLAPSHESWNELDDREVLCLIEHYDDTQKTGSARNSGI